MTTSTDTSKLSRAELDALAVEKGIAEPKAYSNADELRLAIAAAEAGEPIPDPKKKTSGATVTLTAAPEGFRAARVADTRFVITTPVTDVNAETVKAVQEFTDENPEYEFEID